MAPFWTTPKFKKLQNQWYEKIKEQGFKDIEEHPHTLHQETAKFVDIEAVKDYYSKVASYLYEGEFSSYKDKAIWYLHTEGLSYREISNIVRTSRTGIGKVVLGHLRIMKLVK